MSTSGSYNFTVTRNDIIQSALRKIGAMGDQETIVDSAAANRLTAGINAINPMIKAFQAKGMPLWAQEQINVAMSNFATVGFKTIGPSQTISLAYKIMRVVEVYRRDTLAASDIEMNLFTWSDFLQLPIKAEPGTPLHFQYQPTAYAGQLRIWPLPDSYWQTNGQLLIRIVREIQDFDAAADEPDFPKEWQEALIYQLAVRLAPEYGLGMNDRQILKQEAKDALDEALSSGTEEGSIYIQPAHRWGR